MSSGKTEKTRTENALLAPCLSMNPLKKEFPIFTNQPTLAYLDSAANTFCPRTVLRAQADYYEKYPANVARGLYPLSIEATEKYQAARSAVAEYLEVSPEEVIFTAGATMSAGMIAHGLRKTLSRGQNILLSRAEHHANFLPWWEVAREIGAEVRLLELDADGFADPEDLRRKLDDRSAVLALTHASNVLGGVNPVKELFTLAREIAPQIITVLDASQSIAHGPLSLPEAGCDFLFFSGHKVYAPGGTGVLAGRAEKLRLLSPLLYGGEMVATVGEKEIVYKDI
ncbi:MAG TPA: aminotransferase class V-fold PLP-dependent enzyme, partial [Candidatus Moranbacteria bacterium]|nr:aminotransferase class V-fold PLP-dependent enzyme [Candidatus Moranbacteria bacterium]